MIRSPDRFHVCPGPDCQLRVPPHQLMCRRHWYQVPPPLRREVNAAWAAKQAQARGANSRHREAMAAAIESLQ